MNATPLQDDIVHALREGPLTAKQIAIRVGSRTHQPVNVALKTLVNAGRVKRCGFSKPPYPVFLFELVA